jgi:hypothetical protein
MGSRGDEALERRPIGKVKQLFLGKISQDHQRNISDDNHQNNSRHPFCSFCFEDIEHVGLFILGLVFYVKKLHEHPCVFKAVAALDLRAVLSDRIVL